MAGYFIENEGVGTTTTGSPRLQVRLGDHAFASVVPTRRVARGTPAGGAAMQWPLGGGVLDIAVVAQEERYNRGDAEWWAGQMLTALALSGPGELGVNDTLWGGRGSAFADALFRGGVATIEAGRFVTLRLEFTAPERSSAASYGSAPDAIEEYAGRSSALVYVAGGATLGAWGEGLQIETSRDARLREIPRASGSRTGPPASGAMMRLTVRAVIDARLVDHAAAQIEALARAIGPNAVVLTGNGNTWTDVVMTELRPEETDEKGVAFEAVFERQIE